MRAVCLPLVLAAACLSSCAPTGSADFSKINLQAPTGGIMFAAPILAYPYVVWISPVTSDRKVGNAVVLPVTADRSVTDPATGLVLKLAAAKPGQYVVRLITWQGHWGACLAQSTAGFTVEPGKIAYLGALEPAGTLRSIETEAQRIGKTSAEQTQLRLFRENLIPPSFNLAVAPTRTEAVALANANGLRSALPVIEVETSPASFVSAPGSDLVGYCD